MESNSVVNARPLSTNSEQETRLSELTGVSIQQTQENTQPPAKRPRTAKGSKGRGKGRRGNAEKLAGLMRMPIDIFFEIARILSPGDLLQLARVSKFIRSILMTRSTKGIWNIVLSSVEDLPPCPEDLCEPAYVSLVFGSECQECGTKKYHTPDYTTRVRSCTSCYRICTASMSEISTVTQDRKKLKLILCSTAMSTKGIRFNRAVAMETLHALHAVENDEEALETFLKEREQRAIAIKEHAQKLTRWKEHINSVNQAQGYDALTRRQEIMTERLVQLGYTREEIKIVPSNEFHGLMKQPRDLTPFIWDRALPKLIAALEESKLFYIQKRKLGRIRQRQLEISEFVRQWAYESCAHRDLEWLDRKLWMEIFPTKDLLYSLPSVASLIADDESRITGEVARSHEAEILADIKMHQVEVRRLLVGKLPGKGGDDAGNSANHGGDDNELLANATNSFDLQVDAQAEDKQNITLLMNPTTFFSSTYPNLTNKIWNYPEVLGNHPTIKTPTKEHPGVTFDLDASTMAQLILDGSPDLDIPNWDTKWRCGSSFVCLCCPKRLRKGLSWRELVRHFVEEMDWYKRAAATAAHRATIIPLADAPIIPAIPVINTHAHPRGGLLTAAESSKIAHVLDAAEARDHSEGRLWYCKYCTMRSDGGCYSRQETALHLKIKHGITGGFLELEETHMAPDPSTMRRYIFFEAAEDIGGCQCDECLDEDEGNDVATN